MEIYFPPSIQKLQIQRSGVDLLQNHLPFLYDIVGVVKPKILVELGVDQGNSFTTFCRSMKDHNIDGLCYGVGNWNEFPGSKKEAELSFKRMHHFYREKFQSISYITQMQFDEALKHFDDGIDLLHIDGTHPGIAIDEEFQRWFPSVNAGGIVLIKNISSSAENANAHHFWKTISEQNSSFTFSQGCGLGVVRKSGKSTASEESQLLKLLFSNDQQTHADLEKVYVHAAEFLQMEKDFSKTPKMFSLMAG